MIKAMWSSVVLVLCANAFGACAAPVDSGEFAESELDGGPVGETQQALFHLCENVNVEVTNLREESNGARPDIKVTALSFYDADRARWNKQGVNNRVINYSDYYPYTEDLENADGHTITRWRVYYKVDLGNGWSSERNQETNTADVTCDDGMSVELTVTD